VPEKKTRTCKKCGKPIPPGTRPAPARGVRPRRHYCPRCLEGAVRRDRQGRGTGEGLR
jgi:predicted RNA-binding Zn-ribbon protein involved in translation (DUF1610 family)